MRRQVGALCVSVLLVGCAAADPSSDPAAPSAPLQTAAPPSAPATAESTPEPSASPTPTPSESAAPRALFGTWRTTLAGDALSLSISETTYRIRRGSNSATGSVTIDGDRIEFFDSNLCAGTGVYRWTITDGTLSFFPLEAEPCPGRADALLVRYPDYSPPD